MLRHLKNGKKSSFPRIYFHLILYIYNKKQKIGSLDKVNASLSK